MTRKDTILVAVVINAGLLAILFATAVIYDEDNSDETLRTELAMNTGEPAQNIISNPPVDKAPMEQPLDVLDKNLKDDKALEPAFVACAETPSVQPVKELPSSEKVSKETPPSAPNKPLTPAKNVEKKEKSDDVVKVLKKDEPVYHTVKSGDNPWKIAKQHGVKYDDILRLNNLNEEKARNLKIGDRIRVK